MKEGPVTEPRRPSPHHYRPSDKLEVEMAATTTEDLGSSLRVHSTAGSAVAKRTAEPAAKCHLDEDARKLFHKALVHLIVFKGNSTQVLFLWKYNILYNIVQLRVQHCTTHDKP